jgi:SAM-dependent methyltransferase
VSGSHFDDIAQEYDASLPGQVVEHYLRKREAFIVAQCEDGRVLDVGCGTGALAVRLAARGLDVVGVDPSAEMLSVLSKRGPGIEAVVADGAALPFPDGEFDLSYCVAVMHHIAEPTAVRRTLAEMVRVVRPGGRVIVWDHNPTNPYWPIVMRRVPQDIGDERLIPASELLDGLRAAGAHPVLTAQTGLVPDFAPRSLMGVFRGLERAFEATPGLRRLCAHNVIVAVRAA